jgi:hypothetical protein
MSARLSGLLESGHGWTIYEYAPFCNGPGDVKSPRVIATPPRLVEYADLTDEEKW